MVGTGGRTELTEGDLLQAFCQFAKSGDYYDSPTRSFNEAGYAVLNERNRDGYLMHHQTVNALAYLGLFESPDQLSARDLTLMNYLWPRMAPLKDGKCTYDRFRSVVQSHVRSATREHEELLMMQHSGAAGAANRRNRDYSTRDVSPEFTYRLAGSPGSPVSPGSPGSSTPRERLFRDDSYPRERSYAAGSYPRGRSFNDSPKTGTSYTTYTTYTTNAPAPSRWGVDRTVSPPRTRTPGTYPAQRERLMSPSPLPDKRPGLMSPTLRPAERNERNMGGQSSPMLRPAHRKSGLISPQPRREYKSESGSPAAASRDAEPASASADTSWDHSRRSRQSSSSSSSHGASQRNDRALKDSIAALREDLRILVKERKAWEANSRSRGDKSSSAGDSDSDDGSLSRKKRSLVEEVDYLHARVIKERELKRKREEATRARERQSLADREAAERQSWDAYDRDRTTANKEMMAIPVNMTVYLGSGAVYSDLRRGGLPAVRNWKKAAAKDLGDGFQISRGDVRPHVKEVEPNLIRVLFHVLAPADEAGKMKAVLEGRLRQYPTLRLEEASRSFERESRVPSGCFLRMNSSWVGRPKPSTKQSDSEVQKGDVSFLVDQPYETFRAAPFHAAMKRHKDNPKMYMDMVDVRQKKKKPVVTFRVSGTGDDAGHSRRLVASANDERSPIHRDVTRISKAWLVDGSKRGASSSSSSSSSSASFSSSPSSKGDRRNQQAPARNTATDDTKRSKSPPVKSKKSSSSSSSDRKPKDDIVIRQEPTTEHHVYRRTEAAPVTTTEVAPEDSAPPTPHYEPHTPSAKSRSSSSSSSSSNDRKSKNATLIHQVHTTEHHVYTRAEAAPVLTTKASIVHTPPPAKSRSSSSSSSNRKPKPEHHVYTWAPQEEPHHTTPPPAKSRSSSSSSSNQKPKDDTLRQQVHTTDHHVYTWAAAAPVQTTATSPDDKPQDAPNRVAKPLAKKSRSSSSSSSSSKGNQKDKVRATKPHAKKARSSSSSSSDRKPNDNVVTQQVYGTEHHVYRREEAAPVQTTQTAPVHKPTPHDEADMHSVKSWSSVSSDKEQHVVHQVHDTEHHVYQRGEASPVLTTLTAPVDKPTHDDDSDMHSVDSHSPSSSSSKDEKHATEHRFFHQQAVLAPVDSAPPPPRTEKTSPPKGFAKMPPPAPPVKARSSSSSSSSSSSDRKPKENVVHQTYATEHRVIHRKEASPVVETKMSPVHKPSVAPPTSSASHSPSSGSDGKPKEQFVHQTYDTVHSVVHRKQSSTALETKVTTSDQSLPSTPGPSNEQKPVPKRKKHRRRASASPSPARSSSSSSTSTGERGKRRQPAAPRMKTPPVSGSPSSGSSGRAPPHGTRKSPHNAPHVVGPGGAGSSASSGASSVLRIGGVKGPLAVKTSAPALVPPPLASPMSSFGHQRQQQSSDEEGEVDTFKC